MKIGELARVTRTQVETIRYYESKGLLSPPSRTAGNYRIYTPAHAERLSFIRHCRSLDMALEEIRALLHFKDSPAEPCGDVNLLLDAHIGHVSTRIHELQSLEHQLQRLRDRCDSTQDAAHCGILSELSETPDYAKPTPATRMQGTHGRLRAHKG
jgi:Cd(II)/Pb(II)-responsive transcriptional regulator